MTAAPKETQAETRFGYESVPLGEKHRREDDVFHSVARRKRHEQAAHA